MARYTGAVCRLCRREDMKLFLKGERCYTDKCGYERRSYPPGQHGQSRRRKRSDYGEQLREKQKVKRIYGIAERQFRGYYHKAVQGKGVSGHTLIQLLERRLDNVAYRMGFASDHAEARQLVRHGHFTINGKKVDIPSYLVKAKDVIQVRESSQKIARINEALAAVDREVTMAHELPRLRALGREPETVGDVVEPALEQLQQRLTGDAAGAVRHLEVAAELVFEHAVDALDLLLLTQLHAVAHHLRLAQLAVLTGRQVALLDRALLRVAALPLEEQLHPLAAAQAADRSDISSHSFPSR